MDRFVWVKKIATNLFHSLSQNNVNLALAYEKASLLGNKCFSFVFLASLCTVCPTLSDTHVFMNISCSLSPS